MLHMSDHEAHWLGAAQRSKRTTTAPPPASTEWKGSHRIKHMKVWLQLPEDTNREEGHRRGI